MAVSEGLWETCGSLGCRPPGSLPIGPCAPPHPTPVSGALRPGPSTRVCEAWHVGPHGQMGLCPPPGTGAFCQALSHGVWSPAPAGTSLGPPRVPIRWAPGAASATERGPTGWGWGPSVPCREAFPGPSGNVLVPLQPSSRDTGAHAVSRARTSQPWPTGTGRSWTT